MGNTSSKRKSTGAASPGAESSQSESGPTKPSKSGSVGMSSLAHHHVGTNNVAGITNCACIGKAAYFKNNKPRR